VVALGGSSLSWFLYQEYYSVTYLHSWARFRQRAFCFQKQNTTNK
jgi:hypothetical protein